MKRTIPMESASAFIDAKINELGDWRGKMLAKVRAIIHKADPEIVERVQLNGDSRLVQAKSSLSLVGDLEGLEIAALVVELCGGGGDLFIDEGIS